MPAGPQRQAGGQPPALCADRTLGTDNRPGCTLRVGGSSDRRPACASNAAGVPRRNQKVACAGSTIARSRYVRNAASNASTAAGCRIRGNVLGVRTNGTPWRGRCRSRRVGNPRAGFTSTSRRASRKPNRPDTLDRPRRTVRAETPTAPSATGCSRPSPPPVCCAVPNPSTSADVTSRGGLPTTAKNTFRS